MKGQCSTGNEHETWILNKRSGNIWKYSTGNNFKIQSPDRKSKCYRR